jgi:hypothetical protein
MSVKKYRFVSPGVFVNEIDNSQVPASPAGIGPIIIGRAEKGPALRPVTVNSFEEFVQVFGTPAPGGVTSGRAGDVWRKGNDKTAATYGMYAAQAYLKNSSPLTFVRLLGAQTTADGGPVAASDGEGGWNMNKAFGLIVFNSASNNEITGALAAIFYGNSDATFSLTGNLQTNQGESTSGPSASSYQFSGPNGVVGNISNANQFKLIVGNYRGTANLTTTFNFTEGDSRYIRKVFNTNPQMTNSSLMGSGETQLNYFLGETFDRHLKSNITNGTMAAIVQLYNTGSSLGGADFNGGLNGAQTPPIIGCRLDPTDEPIDLFTVHALEEPGDWTNRNLKISIQDIKRPTGNSDDYGTFTLVVRQLSDSDNVVKVVEQFNECDLNPESANFIARRIGDKYREWVESERRYIERGNYRSNSSYIRVKAASMVEGGLANASLLPFGFRGMVKYDDEELDGYANGSKGAGNWVSSSIGKVSMAAIVAAYPGTPSYQPIILGAAECSASVLYPAPELRVSASSGDLSNNGDAYFGFQTSQGAGSTVFDHSTIDLCRPRGGEIGAMFAVSSQMERSVDFTLDDICGNTNGLGNGVWISGSHSSASAAASFTYLSGAVSGVLDAGFDRFSVPMYGGFDGVNITEMDPFNSSTRAACLPTTATDKTSYSFNTYNRVIDAIADPEVVEMNLASAPGLTNSGLTTKLVRTCEDRADALAVIDLPYGYTPRESSVVSNPRQNLASTIRSNINDLRDRGLNSSYGCTFYPWVRARDTINGTFVWVPPSVAAIGTFSSSQKKTQVWFAPAGFNRGGLSEGSAGIPVTDVAHALRRKDRDDLYASNINPIAKFPAEGIVIFGQKTLQTTPSALDRINVRRLMIFVKKRISQMATTILFDPNVKTTWKRFTSMVEPFLSEVKAQFGLSDYKLILDDTTTTPELVDRNIMYAQIFLKPTRAIEFIAIDFNITRTGASFDD